MSFFLRQANKLVHQNLTVKTVTLFLFSLSFVAGYVVVAEPVGEQTEPRIGLALAVNSAPIFLGLVWSMATLWREIDIIWESTFSFSVEVYNKHRYRLNTELGLSTTYPIGKWVETRLIQGYSFMAVLWLVVTFIIFRENHPISKLLAAIDGIIEIVCKLAPYCG